IYRMESGGSKRARNFTDMERNLLFDLVMEQMHIIENKKTDATTIRHKNEAWAQLTQKYNSNCQTGPRNQKQLHALYDILKQKSRKNLHDDKKNSYKTGGGTFTPLSDELDYKIATMLKPQYQPLTNVFDSSVTYFQGRLMLQKLEQNYTKYKKSNNEKENVPKAENVLQAENVHEVKQFVTQESGPSSAREMIVVPLSGCTLTPSAPQHNASETANIEHQIKEIELKLKQKYLELKDKQIQLKNIEMVHIKRLQEIDLEIKEKELEIRNWEHDMKENSYKLYLEK
ncbi:hypothetical protein NQ314_020266, partial [Rhamnusium bicolor]